MTWRLAPPTVTLSPLPPVSTSVTVIVGLQRGAGLVEQHHLQVGAEPDHAGIGREAARQQVDQRGLAGAVRADDAEPVAAHHPDREVVDDRALAVGLGASLASITSAAGGFGLGRGSWWRCRPGGGRRGAPCAARAGCRAAGRCACAAR